MLPFGEQIPTGINGRSTDYGLAVFPSTPDGVKKFTGKERDTETGLDYFGARYFSGAQGRFTSPDWSQTPQATPYANLGEPQTRSGQNRGQNPEKKAPIRRKSNR